MAALPIRQEGMGERSQVRMVRGPPRTSDFLEAGLGGPPADTYRYGPAPRR